jgi:uncharacterized phage protein (TIGR01671 family)
MENIKFRGKTLNGNWVYGYPICSADRAWIKDVEDKTTNPRQVNSANNTADFRCVEIIPETVGQYTGFYDETDDDIEVFEGDVIDFEYEDRPYTGSIKFEAGCFIVVNNELPDSYLTLLDISENNGRYCWINGRVIGNIYENPELLADKS